MWTECNSCLISLKYEGGCPKCPNMPIFKLKLGTSSLFFQLNIWRVPPQNFHLKQPWMPLPSIQVISTVDSCYSKLLLIYDRSHFHRISRLSQAGCLHWGTSKAGQAGRHRSATEGSPCPRCWQGLCTHQGSSDTGSSDALCSWIAGVQQHKA